MAHTDKTISHAIHKLVAELARHGGKSITVELDGQTIEVNQKYLTALSDRELTHVRKGSKGAKKSKEVSPDRRDQIVDTLHSKVEYALSHNIGIKLTPALRKVVLEHVHTNLTSRKACPKLTTFAPRLLFFMDDHFSEFLKGIHVGLLSKNIEGSGSATIREELTKVEDSFMAYLRKNQVGASTVLNALVVHYTTSEGLRQETGDYKSLIKMDKKLKEFLDSPMDSAFRGKSLASKYKAKQVTKKPKKSKDGSKVEVKEEDLLISLAGYRMENPKKSVRDYLLQDATPMEQKHIKSGYLMGKHIMSLVSAHLIPAGSFTGTDGADDLSMDIKDDHYVNPNVNTLIALQALLSTTGTPCDKAPAQAQLPARSPSRSPARARSPAATPTRTPSKSPARSPGRAASRSRSRQ